MTLKRDAAKWQKMIDKHIAGIAKQRDALDDTINQLTDLKECCDRAHENLECARDALSELT